MRAASRSSSAAPSSAPGPAAAGLVVSQPFLLSSFIGREAELKRGVTLLGRHRLVTLTGTGGCGKTRLAVELAQREQAAFAGGTWFADLARVDQAEFVLAAIAAAIGVDEPERNRSLADEIVRRLQDGRFLIVLDNCEHVIEAASTAAAALLQGATGLTILATSREPLSVPGEVIWTLPGLPADDATGLFAERAAQARPDLVLDDAQRGLIRRICRRLDGLPLAVELAAARAQALSVARIADSLDSHLALLGGAPRTAPARHATIRASFDWSYQLLETDERVLLAELSVFAGGFGLDDALAVCADASVEAVARLVGRSLVALVAGSGEPRYRLPETIRQFAAEHLAGAPEVATETSQRHARHYLALAEQAEPHLTRATQDDWLARLAAEADNLRAALAWARDQPAPTSCARLAVALTPYWLERSNWSECRFWLAAAEQAGPLPPALEARVLNRRCYLEMWAGDISIVPPMAMKSLGLLAGLDEPVETGRASGFLGVLIANSAGPDAARPHMEEALAQARAGGDDWGLAMGLAFFADASLFQARPAQSRQMLDEAIVVATAAGDRRTLRIAQSFAALAAVTQGRLEEAIRRARWAADEARTTGHETPLVTALAALGWALLLQGRPADARAATAEGLAAARASEEGPVLEGLALWADATVLAYADPAGALPMFDEAHRLTASSRKFAPLTSLAVAEARLACGAAAGAAAHAGPLATGAAAQAGRLAGEAGCAWLVGRVRLVQARLAADPAAAESAVHEAVAQARVSGDVLGLINALELLAALAAARGDAPEELRLRGAASAARARQSYAWTPPGTPGRDQHPPAAWTEGEDLSIEAALAYAARGRGRRRRPASGWPSLTPTELEVVRLVARHQSNPEIAERLFVSRATVKTHLVHIFAKLSVRSRSELAAEAIRRGLASEDTSVNG
jgi:predicted ATPase/DNA-binding CsgD family transcriptional regulator